MQTSAEPVPPQKNFALVAAIFEGSLALLALALGWLFALGPLETFRWDPVAVGVAVTGTLPMLLLFWLCLKVPFGPFRRILRIIDELLVPMFRQCGLLELLVISILAGLGEELLFRGIVQAGVAQWVGGPAGVWIGLIVAAFLFALLHMLTAAYAVLAGLIGLYLGALWLTSGNLLVPVIVHALYDFLALTYIVKLRKLPEVSTDGPAVE